MAQAEKVAIITGASRGIGKAISIELARRGYAVVVTARSTTVNEVTPWPGTIHETAEAIRAEGGTALPVRLDLADMDNVREVVSTTMDTFGRIDVMVNNARYAGEGYVAMFVDTSWEALDQMISTNVRAVVLFHKLCLPIMIEQGGGVFINVTSGGAIHESPNLPGNGATGLGYPVTKAASHRLVAALAKEVREHNVAVINLDPGHTLTERHVAPGDAAKVSHAGVDRSDTHTVWVPARAAVYLATCPDPLAYTGTNVVARRFVEEMDLMTAEELASPWKGEDTASHVGG